MNKKGFTLTELLVTLLMISVIMVIVVPSAVGLLDDIEMSRLNSAAKEIFLSAQHEFIYLDTAGSLCKLNDISSETETCRYVVIALGTSFPRSSTLLSTAKGTSAIIEYAQDSASVGAVFFSETLTASELEELYLTNGLSDPDDRRSLRIGYYGGDSVTMPPREHTLAPKITVRNGEDLWLEVACGDIPEAEADSFEVRITLKSGSKIAELAVPEVTVIDDTLSARILLDTMQPYGIPFAVRFPAFGFKNVTAEAKITYHGKNGEESTPKDIMQKTAVTFNPLFGSSDGDSMTVSRVRHLNNLRYIDTAGVAVIQTQDIAFKNTPVTEFYYGSQRETQITPIPEFAGTFNGGDFLIKNISLNTDDTVAGLFTEVSGELKNIHLTGTARIAASETLGTLCGHLTETGRISNCSVSEMTIEAHDGATVGGLVGICDGVITRSSAVLEDVTLGDNCTFGGITGKLDGGEVTCSHSSGRIASAENSLICGVASGVGTVRSCYSECTTAYISGSDFYGVCPEALNASDSFFILENAWLALDADRAVEREDAALSGFGTPQRAVVDSLPSPVYAHLPETVTQNGTPTRFGASKIPEPRGLIGLLEVTYDGSFSYRLHHSFDAYGNDSLHYPAVTWGAPAVGETRIYVFRSESAAPENGASGWECTTDGSLGADMLFGNFICKQVTDAEKVTLRFGDVTKTSEFFIEETIPDGLIGVIGVLHDHILDIETLEYREYISSYCYLDVEDGSIYVFEYGDMSGNNYNEIRLFDLEDFTFEPLSAPEIRVYIFSTSALKPEKDWTAVTDAAEITEAVCHEPYTLYEIFRGYEFEPITVELTLSNGRHLKACVEFDISSSSGFYCVPRIQTLN